jgi:hypothetical protein
MARKSPPPDPTDAAPWPTTPAADLTPEEAAQRARIVARALRTQAALNAAQRAAEAPQTAESETAAKVLARLDRTPTADERQAAAEHARRQAIYRANVEHGYSEWGALLDGEGAGR